MNKTFLALMLWTGFSGFQIGRIIGFNLNFFYIAILYMGCYFLAHKLGGENE